MSPFHYMRRLRQIGQAWLNHLIVLTLCGLLLACGAGGIVLGGGVGSGGTGVAEGAVSGFGSVIVDGVTYADADASVVIETAGGTLVPAEVKLGQRVRIRHQQAGVADQIQVMPQLRGTASTSQSGDWFVMLGQWVRVVSSSDVQNPATWMEGLTSVVADDPLEVHGTWAFDAGKNAMVLVASRIEKLTSSPDPLWVSGVVQARASGVNTVILGGKTALTLSAPSVDAAIGEGSVITAWVPASAWVDTTMAATRLVDAVAGITANDRWVLSAPVQARDLILGQMTVQGLPVRLSPELQAPVPGTSVQVEMVKDGSGWKAVSLQERQSSSDLGGAIELKGALTLPADTSVPLVLRGTPVSLAGLTLDASCDALRGQDNVFVSLLAARGAPGQPLQANRVTCSGTVPDNGVIEVEGQLTSVSPAEKALVVSLAGRRISLVWSDKTWMPPSPQSLVNQRVDIEYQVVNGQNRLRKLKLH